MNLLKNLLTYTKKILCFLKLKTVIIEPKESQHLTQTAVQFSKFYDIDDIPLRNFDKCLSGQYEYMSKDEKLYQESQMKFMDIYFNYISQVGGGGNWAIVNREYADLKIQYLLLSFSKELIQKGMFDDSYCKKAMLDYYDPLPEGHELAMIDSLMASLQLSLDSVSKQIKNLNKQEGKGQTLVSILTTINNANKLYLPYNSVLLIEFIEQLKSLKEQQKKIQNGRLNK